MKAPNRREPGSGLPLAIWPAVVAISLSAGWAATPVLAALGGRLQFLGLLPDWAWLVAIGFCLLVAVAVGVPGRDPRRWKCVALTGLAAVGPMVGTLQRDLGLPHRSVGDVMTLVFLNANDPGERRVDGVRDCDRVLERLVELDADVTVLVNPGWRVPGAWRRSADVREGRLEIRWVGSVLVASRVGIRSIRVLDALRDLDIEPVKSPPRAVEIELDVPVGGPLPKRILVIDLPSEQGIDRLNLAKQVAGRLESVRPGLILGDLNMAPRSPAIRMLAPGFEDVFRRAGRGWGATWPRETPWLRIDFALTPDRFTPTTIRTFDPGAGGHRGLVMEYSD
ncbi:MAG: hypothetical protein GY871_05030 [Actinomycetales bacterium]|nr:hypothetical protein [Actinomycetales bacterium]